jgi:hypothetical protein
MASVAAPLVAALLTAATANQGLAEPAERICVSSDVRKSIERAIGQVSGIQMMESSRTYTLPVGGAPVTGRKEEFLRRRTAAEILASRLSSGCGDYAVAFIQLIEKCGLRTLLADGAEMSAQSLQSRFSGHAVVAVRDDRDGHWILADPTNKRILADPWSPTDKIFGGMYWIGFSGPLSDYPAHDAASLRSFYDRTLKSIPTEVLNRHVVRMRFTVDPSLIGEDGKYLNPNLGKFLENNGRILDELGLRPETEVRIRLVKGGDDARSALQYSEEAGWVCTLGLRSGCSAGFAGYLERTVAARLRSAE